MIPVLAHILTIGGAPSPSLTKKLKERRTEVLIQEKRREREEKIGKEREIGRGMRKGEGKVRMKEVQY